VGLFGEFLDYFVRFLLLSSIPYIRKIYKLMKKYPSVWITKILKEDPTREVWDISVKMNARIKAAHFEKESKEEAINFCIENYGGYDSIKEMI
jgi:hypothetical protein